MTVDTKMKIQGKQRLKLSHLSRVNRIKLSESTV